MIFISGRGREREKIHRISSRNSQEQVDPIRCNCIRDTRSHHSVYLVETHRSCRARRRVSLTTWFETCTSGVEWVPLSFSRNSFLSCKRTIALVGRSETLTIWRAWQPTSCPFTTITVVRRESVGDLHHMRWILAAHPHAAPDSRITTILTRSNN